MVGLKTLNFCDAHDACTSEFAPQVVQSLSLLELSCIHSGTAIWVISFLYSQSSPSASWFNALFYFIFAHF